MKPTVIHDNENVQNEEFREDIKEEIKAKKAKKKITRLVEYLQSIQDQNFTGYIKVNFSQGSVGRIEKFEEILSK
jgi:NADH:ubiquinone oxidoreductase subunit E